MRYTLFGRTGLRVSELALGAMTFGDDWGWGASEAESARLFETFAEAGGTFVDTADQYTDGTSERILGRLLKGRRDAFVVATKYTCSSSATDLNAGGSHRKNLVNSLEGSLRRLDTDHVDILYVHARDVLTPVEETMRALDDQVRAGKVLYVAVSDWPAWEIAQADTLARLRGWTPFAGVQLRLNLLERTPERELLPMAAALDLGVVAFGALAEGRLTGKYLRGEAGRLDTFDWGGGHDRTAEIYAEVAAVAEEGGWSPAQVAITWLRTRPGTVVPLIGARTAEQLRTNLAALEVDLDPDQVRRLDEVSRIDLGFPHDFLAAPVVRESVYGPRWQEITDHRTTARPPFTT
ncbi:aldo/keto reductase [Streptomonospora sp. S1-112]|uniref:Aldo/keto reductase n=1 Tax=Streptomonospora mangrovi TaxID=2883123 RepID=A0A9X3NLQ4_9ACTN|nr:aldo/keto reductase [Streptomonospora mangrovi]MDA0565772.1 aldo/keto reductase [Streptomonospora mangrovi]